MAQSPLTRKAVLRIIYIMLNHVCGDETWFAIALSSDHVAPDNKRDKSCSKKIQINQ